MSCYAKNQLKKNKYYIMNPFIKIIGNAKIYDKTVIQIGPAPIDYDTILLEDESGYVLQEDSGQIALEIQQ